MKLFTDFRLLLILFVGFRVTMLIAYQPLPGQAGVMAGGDYFTYYDIASLSREVGPPYDAWWSEFPPGWTLLSVGLFQLQGQAVSFSSYATALSVVMLLADTGILVLLRALALILYDDKTAMALAWIYALLIAPLVFTWWTFEPLVAFWLLLALWWLVQGRDLPSAVAAAVGTLTKFTPALLFGAVLRYRPPLRAARYIAVTLGLFALAYLPLLLNDAAMTLPSLTAQAGKASYQTIWALLDGNYTTGNFGPLVERLDPVNISHATGNPPVIPTWLRLGTAVAIGLIVFLRTRRTDAYGVVAFTTITLLIFFLQAQGWSPQWLVQIIPLVLLCFPNRTAVLAIVVLSLGTFVEYPLLFSRTFETGGVIAGTLQTPFVLLVLLRTTMLVGLCVLLYRQLRQEVHA